MRRLLRFPAVVVCSSLAVLSAQAPPNPPVAKKMPKLTTLHSVTLVEHGPAHLEGRTRRHAHVVQQCNIGHDATFRRRVPGAGVGTSSAEAWKTDTAWSNARAIWRSQSWRVSG
jgi:hypothetical protein